jgi:hypothetical protein
MLAGKIMPIICNISLIMLLITCLDVLIIAIYINVIEHCHHHQGNIVINNRIPDRDCDGVVMMLMAIVVVNE